MTHKIAIITTQDVYYNYGDDHETLVKSITDWEEVSDEDFRMLQQASYKFNFFILEQPTDTKAFIAKTISDYKELVKQEAAKAAEEKRKREERAQQRKFQKELKDKESKKALLEKLKAELGEV